MVAVQQPNSLAAGDDSDALESSHDSTVYLPIHAARHVVHICRSNAVARLYL
jgi:hypothetical protein